MKEELEFIDSQIRIIRDNFYLKEYSFEAKAMIGEWCRRYVAVQHDQWKVNVSSQSLSPGELKYHGSLDHFIESIPGLSPVAIRALYRADISTIRNIIQNFDRVSQMETIRGLGKPQIKIIADYFGGDEI